MKREGRAISLEMAFLHCEQQLGGAWVHAPSRWATSDGCVPVRVVWVYFRTLRMARARHALDTARGIGLAFGSKDDGHRAATAAFDDAFPASLEAVSDG